jgi:tetratricopeptide (TPR) repeat protein
LLNRAARLSASTRRHRVAAETQHDLLALAVEAGTYEESESHMLEALRHYPIHHPAVPRLVHDWSFLLVHLGRYGEALQLLETVLPHFRSPEGKVGAWGTLGLAAAGAGERERYDQALEHVQRSVSRTQEFAAAAHANLAQGARFWRQWDLGRNLAMRAIEIAQTRRELDVERGAREFLSGIEAQELPSSPPPLPSPNQIQEISRQVFRLLEARMRPARRPVQLEDTDADRPFDPPAGQLRI